MEGFLPALLRGQCVQAAGDLCAGGTAPCRVCRSGLCVIDSRRGNTAKAQWERHTG